MRCTFPKVHLSKTNDWHHPLRIVPYRAIFYAPLTVTWSNFVNNTLIASIYQRVYIRLLRRDQGIVYVFLDHVTVIGARLLKDAKNRAKRHDAKGRCQSCIVSERCTFVEVSRMQFILFPCVLSWIERLFGDDVKNSCLALL